VEYLLERPDVKDAWREHTHHEFVAGLADGSLPVEAFKYYLVQDYLYLVSISSKQNKDASDLLRYNLRERMPWRGTRPKQWRILQP
jgi:thiaminase